MYDALLEDLEEEETPSPDEAAELVDKDEVAVELGEDDEIVVAEELDAEPDLKSEDLLLATDESESWSDDPVRMYLTQMGEIPLLTRAQEIALAKQIEITRARFRRKLIECDFVIQEAVRILHRVHVGELPFDRTVQVSVTDRLEKDQILGRLPHNLRTLDVLLKRNRRDYFTALSKSEGALHQCSGRFGKFDLASDLAEIFFTVALRQFLLGIKQIHLTGATIHE